MTLLVTACIVEEHEFTPLPDDICGNDVRRAAEVCDGLDLAGASCTTVGPYIGGELSCAEDCASVDVTGCDTGPSVPRLRLPANNTYSGATKLPGSARPTFAWEPSLVGDLSELTYELQFGADPTFERDSVTEWTAATSFTPEDDLFVSTAVPVGTRYYWRVRACTADRRCSTFSSAWTINLGRAYGDVNGDGYSDVVVGAEGVDVAGADAGAAYVYFGGIGGGDASADGVLVGATMGDRFGVSVGIVGDLNADGFADIAVGAPYAEVVAWADAGRVYIYFGGAAPEFDGVPDGLLAGGAIQDYLGLSVAGAGDINGDGFDDVVVRGYRTMRAYFGRGGSSFDATPDGEALRAPGFSAGGVGDVNGDGFADVLVGDDGPGVQSVADLYHGALGARLETTVDASFTSDRPDDGFGRLVASAGDVNADGLADLLVGAERDGAGRVYLYLGNPQAIEASPAGILVGEADGDAFGRTASSAGDVNGDGFGDVLVGARWNDAGGPQAGRAYLYFGGAGDVFDGDREAAMTGTATGERFGTAVACAGDVNRDGFSDVVIGAVSDDFVALGQGEVRIFLGGSGGSFDTTSDVEITGPGAQDGFGGSVH